MLPLVPAPGSLAHLTERARRAHTLRHGESQGGIERFELALRVDEPVRARVRRVVEARQAQHVLERVPARVGHGCAESVLAALRARLSASYHAATTCTPWISPSSTISANAPCERPFAALR